MEEDTLENTDVLSSTVDLDEQSEPKTRKRGSYASFDSMFSDNFSHESFDSEDEDDDQEVEYDKAKKIRDIRRETLKLNKMGTTRIPIGNYLPDIRRRKDSMALERSSMEKKSSFSSQKFIDKQSKKITFSIIRELFVRPNKHDPSPNRYIKMTKNPQQPFLVVEDDIDYTPKRLITPGEPQWVRQPMLFEFPRPPKFMNYKPDDMLVTGRKYGNEDDDKLNDLTYAALESTVSTYDSLQQTDSSKAPSMFPIKLPILNEVDKMRISFNLQETETIVFLHLLSKASEVDDVEGKLIEKSNSLHEIVCKRLRKKMNNSCQTSMDVRKRTKETQNFCNSRANKYAYFSNYEYYDTVEKENEKNATAPVFEETEHEVGKVDKVKYVEDKSEACAIVGPNLKITDKLIWYKVGMIMERLLLSNNAMKRQLLFHDHLQNDPFSSNVDFTYELKLLWTLKTSGAMGLSVSSMSWNFYEKNILAVGYGKYNFSDKCKGVVCIWNNKNLAHPEREFHFEQAVTCVSFCKTFADILAVAFYSGWVILINILRQDSVKIVAKNMSFLRTCVSPVWQIAWLQVPGNSYENIVECRGDGYVYQYVRRHLYEKKPIMHLSKVKGNVKGIPHPKKCQPYVIPLVRNPAILCIAIHPNKDGVYFIGSDEGGVYKCSLQDVNQHMDMFLAHNGPVYKIHFHPACSKIFLTCGADWYIRVWGDGIYQPLLTLKSGISAVQNAKWSPFNPTIIIAITDTKTEVWDISRRINYPQATYENPSGNLNTDLTFSRCGQNLCIGDKVGNVFIYALSGMPFTPTNSALVLALILIKALTPHSKLLAELYKLGSPFNVPRIYKNYLNLK